MVRKICEKIDKSVKLAEKDIRKNSFEVKCEFLEQRCRDLWNENESLKFKIFNMTYGIKDNKLVKKE